MTQVNPSFVLEQVNVTGTGNVTLAGVTLPGFRTFSSAVSSGNSFPYVIQDTVTYAYEFGYN